MFRWIVLVIILGIIGWMVWRNSYPLVIGAKDGNLRRCPDSPNCVCSESTDVEHHIDAFPIFENGATSLNLLKDIIKRMPRTDVIESTPSYLYVVFHSSLFHFKDDVEFLVNDQRIEVRSASRVGYGDMGVNRKRIEAIRQLYTQTTSRIGL
jgi:uncharacterized protein (DUF1499 family)